MIRSCLHSPSTLCLIKYDIDLYCINSIIMSWIIKCNLITQPCTHQLVIVTAATFLVALLEFNVNYRTNLLTSVDEATPPLSNYHDLIYAFSTKVYS